MDSMLITKLSSDKLDKSGQWNRFWPEAWERFQSVQINPIEFVDVPTEDWWTNSEDTAVFVLNLKTKNGDVDPLYVVELMLKLAPDEFSYIRISQHKYVIRVWWD